MKFKAIIALILLCCSLSAVAEEKQYYISTSFHEPATDGLRFIISEDAVHWKNVDGIFLEPKVGTQKVLRDPSILRTPDGKYRLVWTSSWRHDRGFGYAESRDLTHWTNIRFVPVMEDTLTVNVWAPELFWDDVNQQAVVVWASCVKGRFPDGTEAHDNNMRLYYSTTKDFKSFTPGKLFYDPGFSCIDATIIKRAPNDYVMVFKDNTRAQRNLRVAFAKSPLGPWSQPSAPFTHFLTEGPTIVRLPKGSPLGSGWLIFFDDYKQYKFGAVYTDDFVHFKDVSDSISMPEGHKHGTIIPISQASARLLMDTTRIHYSGNQLATPYRHDGGLSPVMGVHNIQILRANREHPSEANGGGWTYNHQPMMAYWNGKFYVHYLSDPAEEHVPPSRTMMQTSADGYHWSNPVVLFPPYDVPEDYHKDYTPNPALQYPDSSYRRKPLRAIMHQRVGWYVAKSGILLALGNYGVALDRKDDPNDGNGIGRVVREVRKDGSLGPIYFLYYNHGFSARNTSYPNYKKAPSRVRKACEEILANPRYLMQWVEEADRGDTMIPVNNPYKAYNDYTLPDGKTLVALWKHALTATSRDGGKSWTRTDRAPGFVNSNAKIWGQRLSDGTYATVYNPSEYRWPLAISLSSDGLDYTTLNLVCGEVPPMRYGGNYKSRGPQYVRGIQEHNGVPRDSDLWVAYSMNKEDIWVSHIPVPILTEAHAQANDDFSKYRSIADLKTWNLYSPLLAPITLNGQWLQLSDSDLFDNAVAERKLPVTNRLKVSFDVRTAQNRNGRLEIDFKDGRGNTSTRICFMNDGYVRVKTGARYSKVMAYQPDSTYHFEAILDAPHRQLSLSVNGRIMGKYIFFAPLHEIERITFRTGSEPVEPTVDTPADWNGILPKAGSIDSCAVFRLAHVKSENLSTDSGAAVLKADDFGHYVSYFNTMEPESIVQAIPNASSWEWMKANVPLFECPDKQFEQCWYYRWWTLRKHIEHTPVGYAMTEFLVPRSYADKYNLISSALGHHIHESRWLRNYVWLDDILHTWFYGNNGQPMRKLDAYSSWTPASIWSRYLVDGRKDSLLSFLPRMKWEYHQWDNHRYSTPQGLGLYWQYDVRDAMEETISGGRRDKNARPSINSYMYGNALAIAAAAELSGDEATATEYRLRADTLRRLSSALWDDEASFYEVQRPVYDAQHRLLSFKSAKVREEIGFLPWYFGLAPDDLKTATAWLQLTTDSGFRAPYGITTAERRHPLFRSHGVGKCEWDGAVWPFATAQTLTAMANWLNDYRVRPMLTTRKDSNENQWRHVYFAELKKYVESQSHRGRPYIGEYLDESTGTWLMGDRERSRYYNHSTFNDLIISGLCGLRPQPDNTLVVNPLLPTTTWDYFCLDNVAYHGHRITIVWDRHGGKYHLGTGLSVLVDGIVKGRRPDLGKISIKL